MRAHTHTQMCAYTHTDARARAHTHTHTHTHTVLPRSCLPASCQDQGQPRFPLPSLLAFIPGRTDALASGQTVGWLGFPDVRTSLIVPGTGLCPLVTDACCFPWQECGSGWVRLPLWIGYLIFSGSVTLLTKITTSMGSCKERSHNPCKEVFLSFNELRTHLGILLKCTLLICCLSGARESSFLMGLQGC